MAAVVAAGQGPTDQVGQDLCRAQLRGNRPHGPGKPLLVLEELETETGWSTQKGFIELLNGAYHALRNTLSHPQPDLIVTPESAARRLIFASILMKKIVDAKRAPPIPKPS